MKTTNKITALMLIVLMLLVQMPFAAFAAETNKLTPDTLPNGRVGQAYSKELEFTGETFSAYFSIGTGALPPGLELANNTNTCHPDIQGTPTQEGSYTFTIVVEDGFEHTLLTKEYTLVINPDYPLEIVQDSLGYAYEGSSYSNTVYLTYSRSATWSMEAAGGETLPAGIAINAETGEITWENPVVGKYNIKVTATRNGSSISETLKLIVTPEDGCTHSAATKISREKATCKKNGLMDYWYCDACESNFWDAECKEMCYYDVDELYTVGSHSDKNDDGLCDECERKMPIFKKVTDEKEIASGGTYIVVSKIDDKYYTIKTPEFKRGYHLKDIEGLEITTNEDGTIPYTEEAMPIKPVLLAECGTLDAGLPRYSLTTIISNIPFTLSSNDYSGAIDMYAYEGSKYGYRVVKNADGTVAIASLYAEYWSMPGEGGTGDSGILSAFCGESDSATKHFFSLKKRSAYISDGDYTDDGLTAYPVEIYKLSYSGTTSSGQSYTVSDVQSTVTNDVASMAGFGSNELSIVSGIGDALEEGTVEDIIADEELPGEEFTVQTYAYIYAESANTSGGSAPEFTEIAYDVTPFIEIKDADGNTLAKKEVPDEALNGTKITVTLCVGSMNPEQIIHYKGDGTEEYFYSEHSDKVRKDGAKSFKLDEAYGKGNFVTFEIDSFSKIKILAEAEPETTVTAVTTVDFNLTGFEVGQNIKDISVTAGTETAAKLKPMTGYEASYSICTHADALTGDFSSEVKKTADPTPKFEAGKNYYLVVKFEAKDGYSIIGLTKDKITLGEDDKAEWASISGKTLTAVFLISTSAKYTVTLNGTGTGATGAGEYNEGDTVQIYAGTKSGYSFGGWTADNVTLTNAGSANATFTMPDKDVIVTASWNKDSEKGGGGGGSTRPKTFTLKFISMGGSAVENMEVDKNEIATAPKAPVREGYDFAGWYIDKELKTKYEFTEKVTKNLTLYAAWTENGEVKKDDAEKDEEKPQTPVTDDKKEGFTDVKEDDWFFANVKYVTENGLMNGTSESEFTPQNSLTRAMLVTILYRAAGQPAVNKSVPFADVKADMYYANAVIWAQQNGIVSGVTENEFAPDMNITREQIAAIIYRYAKAMGCDVSVGADTNILSYTDAEEISEYAIEAMCYAVGSGLMKGKAENTLNPLDNATRAEIAAILQRFIEANK